MPFYTYKCPLCDKVEDILVPMEQRNNRIVHSCGSAMVRQMSLPLPPIIKVTGNEMASAMLNSHATDYMKPEHRKAAAKDLGR